MKIAISAESSADLNQELKEKYEISTLPFSICVGDKSFFDGEIKNEELFRLAAEQKTLPKTSAVNVEQFNEHFTKLLEKSDAVIHFSLSSNLSSAYENAVTASKNFKNVYVVDSLSLSSGIGLLAIYAKKLADKGYAPEEIVEMAKKRVPFVQVSSELKRIDYLYKGGRCSALIYFGANLLKIRPQIVVKGGKLTVGKKYRGRYDIVVKKYCDDVIEQYNNPDLEEAFVAYTTADKEIVDIAYNKLKERGFKNIHVVQVGATISCHTGEDCLGVYYINDGNQTI